MKHHEISFCLQQKDKKKRLQQILVLQQLDMFMLALKDRDLKNLKPNTLFLEGEKGHEDNWVVNVEDSLQRAQGLLN